MEEGQPYPHLFSPFQLAGRHLRNRVAHLAILTAMSPGGQVSDRHIQYYLNRARGGAAMIVAEPVNMAPHQQVSIKVNARDDAAMDSLKRWAAAVEGEDCRLLAQVQDAGRGRHAPGRNFEAVGAAALPDDISWTMPHVLSASELHVMIEGFAAGSRRLQACGFSGIEISAGHGHIFAQFMSPWANSREDEFGGDLEGRMRLLLETIAAIRATCGRGFIVGVKAPGDDGLAASIPPTVAAEIVARLARTGIDYLSFAQGTHARTLDMHVPDGHWPALPFRELTRRLRAHAGGVPVMALGRITDPAEAEGILAHGEAEMVGLGRALITDPAWPAKAAAGHARDIRYCVSANSCWHQVTALHKLACDNNPRLAEPEESRPLPPATVRKRVVVIGAGVAGLEAAWVAASRGHEVTLFGRSPEVGGKLRLHASLPGGEALSSIYDFQLAEAQKAGVRLELGVDAEFEDVQGLQPDAVVLATGSSMVWPLCLPASLKAEGYVTDLRTALPGVLGVSARQRGTAVIFDQDHTDGTYCAAVALHRRFERVVIVTPRESIAQDTSMVTRQGIHRRVNMLGIDVEALSEPQWTEGFEQEGRLVCANIYTGREREIENVAFFAYATPRAPHNELAAPLRAAGFPVHLIGDAKVARAPLAATAEGYAIGRSL
ncbi:FAD-dependent oxidoreductase [Roseococcus sp.]|uniref:oxidoreductase n=1 Tax=Roseococcus sp. TaxID=2109646 RepID=UPI003BABE760